MSKKDDRDYMYLIWKDPNSRRNYIVGQLSRNGNYEFEYSYEIKEALKVGFEPVIPFDDIEKKYIDNRLFSPFRSRVPDRRRKGINEILKKYGLNEYDEYELLKKSGGRLPIDSIEFIDPIFDNGEDPIQRTFYIAGIRHYIGCDGQKCDKSIHLEKGNTLKLELEPTNKYDRYAIKICDCNDKLIGYIPRYYSEQLYKLISNDAKYELKVCEINKDNNCNECIRVDLRISRLAS